MRRVIIACSAAFCLGACERTALTRVEAPAWRLEPLTAFAGQAPARPFVRVRGLAMHRDGRLAVVDNGAHAVFLFPPYGGPGTAAGHFGAGPGEYRNPYYAAWLGDTLAVYDPEMGRVLFLKSGLAPAGSAWTLGITGEALVRFYPVSGSKAYLRSVRRDGERFRSVFVGFADGRAHDTIPIPDPPALASGTACHEGPGRDRYFLWPEAPVELVAPVRTDGALATVRTDAYRVMVRGPGGDSIGVARKDIVPAPVSDSAWTRGMAAYTAYIEANDPATCDAKPVRPRFAAPVRALAVSTDGDLWVTSLGRDGFAFDVFGLDGALRATIPAPPHVTTIPIAVNGDRVALVTEEQDGAHIVRVYRIVRGGAGR